MSEQKVLRGLGDVFQRYPYLEVFDIANEKSPQPLTRRRWERAKARGWLPYLAGKYRTDPGGPAARVISAGKKLYANTFYKDLPGQCGGRACYIRPTLESANVSGNELPPFCAWDAPWSGFSRLPILFLPFFQTAPAPDGMEGTDYARAFALACAGRMRSLFGGWLKVRVASPGYGVSVVSGRVTDPHLASRVRQRKLGKLARGDQPLPLRARFSPVSKVPTLFPQYYYKDAMGLYCNIAHHYRNASTARRGCFPYNEATLDQILDTHRAANDLPLMLTGNCAYHGGGRTAATRVWAILTHAQRSGRLPKGYKFTSGITHNLNYAYHHIVWGVLTTG